MSLTEYKIKSQQHMVNQIQSTFDRLTKEIDSMSESDEDFFSKFEMLARTREILIQEEDKLRQMEQEFNNVSL